MKPWKHKYKNTCKLCGCEFHPNRRKQAFCSRACGVRGRSGRTKRATLGLYNSQCRYCGKRIYRKPFLIKKNKFAFCSWACTQHFKRTRYLGKDNPNYQATPPKICEACSKPFVTYSKNRRFCSVECSARGAKNSSRASVRTGNLYEKKCAETLRADGYLVFLSKASRGPYDILAMKETELLLIQVKFSRNNSIAVRRVLDELRSAVSPTGSKKQLWVYNKESSGLRKYEA